MTALPAPTPSEPSPDPEADARRAMGLEAAGSAAIGAAAILVGGPIGRAVGLSPWLVRLTGLAAVGGAGVLGLGSLAEEWQQPTRRVVAANAVVAAALAGHAMAKGTAAGRVGIVCLASAAAGCAAVQARALVAAEPQPGS